MFEALRAEHMAYSLYIRNNGDSLRDMLRMARTPENVLLILGLIFRGDMESKLYKKMAAAIRGMYSGEITYGKDNRTHMRVDGVNYINAIQILMCQVINNSQPVLRATFADMLLKMAVESPVVKADANWEDAKGFVFKMHNPCTRYRIVGVQWPPEPGRSSQLENIIDTEDRLKSTQIMEVGFIKNEEDRIVMSFYQVNGIRILFCGRPVKWDPRILEVYDDELLYATSIVN
jgi:hypothetical protein